MNICMVLTTEFPPDNRVLKEALSLIEAGHTVHLLSMNFSGLKQKENYRGIHIHRLRMNKFLHDKFLPLYLVFPFYRILFYRHLKIMIKDHQIDVIHVHDLPLTDLAIRLKNEMGVNVVADQHEYYSNRLKSHAHMKTLYGKIILAFSKWEKYEKRTLYAADAIITVEDSMRWIYTDNIGISDTKLYTVPNTPYLKYFQADHINSSIIEKYQQNFVLIYVGAVDVQRGLVNIVKAMPEIINTIPNFLLLIVGRFAKKTGVLEEAEKLGIRDYIDFAGWKNIEELPSYLAAADIAIHIPVSKSIQADFSVATKIYQYIQMEKPIVATKRKVLQSIIDGNNIGITVEDDNISQLANAVIQLYTDKELVNTIKNNMSMLKHKYHWEHTSQELIRCYQNLEKPNE